MCLVTSIHSETMQDQLKKAVQADVRLRLGVANIPFDSVIPN